jgi:hypothetical protein
MKTATPNSTAARKGVTHAPQFQPPVLDIHHSVEASKDAPAEPQYVPLEQVNRPTVETGAAAYYLNRRPQTLRGWACLENGPIRPIRINGRLAWKVADIKSLLGVV